MCRCRFNRGLGGSWGSCRFSCNKRWNYSLLEIIIIAISNCCNKDTKRAMWIVIITIITIAT